MRLLGIDFTSAPRPRKPITCATGFLEGDKVRAVSLTSLPDFPAFEVVLRSPGPWVAACDFPFGLPSRFVRDQGWPPVWSEVVRRCATLDRAGFRALLDAHRAPRPPGDRTPHRATDLPARSHSPLKLVNPPVALMFHEGAPRLLAAGVHLPGLHPGDPARTAVEAYPGLWARKITTASYKADDRARQTPGRAQARIQILDALCAGLPEGVRLHLPEPLRRLALDDPAGDQLDALICLAQAGWAAARASTNHGIPPGTDPVEGWITGLTPPG